MKNFLILTNEKKDPGLRISKSIQEYIRKSGGTSYRMCDFNRDIQENIGCITKDTECVIVLGGDGTMLHAARLVVKHDLPMVGVNLGTLGFLTEIELEKLYQGLDCLLHDNFIIEQRMMLDGGVIHNNELTYHHSALNDVVISRSGFSRIISYRIIVNGKLLDIYPADGVIISTPTGSTGYNLSAGGPVVNPSASVILLTPICPHTMSAKSIVLSQQDEIEIYIENVSESQLEEAYVTFDGQVAQKLHPGDVLKVKTSYKIAKVIKLEGDSFYKTLRMKVGGSNEEEETGCNHRINTEISD
ncbi:MAG: NAD(+)/NADH kinase [Anaerostipes faecalis]|nr:NAD(+)/NADH kinase [Anaerostipes faecalis]